MEFLSKFNKRVGSNNSREDRKKFICVGCQDFEFFTSRIPEVIHFWVYLGIVNDNEQTCVMKFGL